MRIALSETRLGLLNSTTRLPFRYGKACMTRCPQAILEATIEVEGRRQRGYSGDCLPPLWFDKSPEKDFAAQIDDMLSVIRVADEAFRGELASAEPFFPAWRSVYETVQAYAAEHQLTPLLAGFGVSMLERALMDAMARAAGLSFAEAVRENLYGIDAGSVHASLAGLQPRDWLPERPRREVWVRHTVGMADPLTSADIAPEARLDDGLPQALEEYVERTGTRYFKIKVANRPDDDLARLEAIAAIVERHRGEQYRVTLDGNEQYHAAAEFDALIDAIEDNPRLATLWANTLVVEQPLERGIALDPQHTQGVRRLAERKPVIIDESDGRLHSYSQAIELGYRGTSSKNCKGPIKSLLNAGLTWLANDRGRTRDYLMTGEDLCTVGVAPVQSDLCLTATLGLTHVERNGHHFHRGLSYLPVDVQQAALAAHGDLYSEQHGVVAPHLHEGRFRIASLQCPGFGFAVLPDLDRMQSPDQWDFASLGVRN
ncbi:MAG: hypothetical protein RIC55_34815 [Pirellulaceae bacterium]